MERVLKVKVASGTWPTGTTPPPELIPTNNRASINILDMMLRIGSLGIPPLATDVSINIWWAWLRYAFTFSSSPLFQLKASYADLDAHQKTVMSDDFGMGVALSYLVPALDLQTVFDGRYFVQFVAPTVGANAVDIAKNGQFKSPDFIGRDGAGRWHAIECKGTQVPHARRAQVRTGRQQKTNVLFPAGTGGEKLVSALLVGREESGFNSSLLIEDPEGEVRFEVPTTALAAAEEATRRATLARALGVIGYPVLASNITSPYGERPYDRETSGAEEQLRLEAIGRKRAGIGLELERAAEFDSDRFTTPDRIGRETVLSAPRPVVTPEGTYGRIRGRLSMPRSAFDIARGLAENTEQAAQLGELDVVGIDSASTSTWAKLAVGSIFEAEIELLP